MKLTFIVNGTETIVEVKPSNKLQTAINKALKQTGNTGRPSSDFQTFLNDDWLQPSYAICNQKETKRGQRSEIDVTLNDDSVIFLSLKAGWGACNKKAA